MTNIAAILATLVLAAPQGTKVDWKKDFDAALRQAKTSEKYLVVHFSGPG